MAGDWIKYDVNLPEKPEVWQIAELTGLSVDAVIGKLLRFWAWFDAHSEDGICNAVSVTQLDALVTQAEFCSAMASVGWLVIHNQKRTVAVPSFDIHNGKSAKKRAVTARRVKRHRNAASNADSVTSALPEKRRIEKIKTPLPPLQQHAETRGARHPERAALARSAAKPEEPDPPQEPVRTAEEKSVAIGNLRAVRGLIPNHLRPAATTADDPALSAAIAELATKQAIPIPADDEETTHAQATA